MVAFSWLFKSSSRHDVGYGLSDFVWYDKLMAESTETELALVKEKVSTIEKNYVTQDQLRLLAQELRPYKQLVIGLLVIIATETIALVFYFIRTMAS